MARSRDGVTRPSWRDAITLIVAGEAVAVAAWLLPASVHIMSWSASAPGRLALLAPRSRLIWMSILALTLATGLIAWGSRRGSTRWLASVLAPFCLLWIWTVPYLPWFPDRFPVLLVLAGPVRWVIAVVAVAGAIRIDRRVQRFFADESRLPGRRAIFATSLAIYLGLGLYSSRILGPGGDEPHYLIITQSLLFDGDLRIEDNYQRREYREFFAGQLRPDYLRRGMNGQIYSIHAPGLPTLLLPAYAIGGYTGAVAFICFLAALGALAVFDLADWLAGRRAAFLTWLATCLTVPFVPHSWQIFPEMPGAAIVAWAVLWLAQPVDQRPATWVWRGLVLGCLPWMHTKFAIFLGVFSVALALRLWRRPRAALSFSALIVLSLAAWLYSFYAIYGELNPGAPYGNYADQHILLGNIPRGVLGLMFDQKFGLFFYSPMYLVSLAGCWMMLRRPSLRYFCAALVLAILVFVGGSTQLYMWWGGSSAPARYLVPLLPCLAPMIALAVRESRGRAAHALVAVWLTFGLAVAAIAALWPARLLIFSEPHGRARLLETIQAASPLALSMPTFTEADWQGALLDLTPWLAAGGLGLAVIVAIGRWRRLPAIWLGTIAAVTTIFAAGVMVPTKRPDLREETARRGALDVMWRYDSSRLRAFDYATLRKAEPDQVMRLATLGSRASPLGPVALPPGSYEARVWFNGTRAREGEVLVSSSTHAVFGRVAGPLQSPAVARFELPVGVRRVSVKVSDANLAAAVQRIELKPAAIVPSGSRDNVPVRAIESIASRPGAYIIYVDERTYPEGGKLWTRDTERASVLVAPAGASRIALTLHLGPRSGEVRITVAGKESAVNVKADATTAVEFDLPRDLRLVPITIQAPGMFRPGEVDPAATDMRRLGCQVRIDLA